MQAKLDLLLLLTSGGARRVCRCIELSWCCGEDSPAGVANAVNERTSLQGTACVCVRYIIANEETLTIR